MKIKLFPKDVSTDLPKISQSWVPIKKYCQSHSLLFHELASSLAPVRLGISFWNWTSGKMFKEKEWKRRKNRKQKRKDNVILDLKTSTLVSFTAHVFNFKLSRYNEHLSFGGSCNLGPVPLSFVCRCGKVRHSTGHTHFDVFTDTFTEA